MMTNERCITFQKSIKASIRKQWISYLRIFTIPINPTEPCDSDMQLLYAIDTIISYKPKNECQQLHVLLPPQKNISVRD